MTGSRGLKNVWRLAINDLRLTARDRPAFIWLLVMPLAMMWFFGNLGGGGPTPPRISLDVVDLDGGWLAEALVAELQDESVALRSSTPEGRDAPGRQWVRALEIPAGFTRGVLAGERQVVHLRESAASSEQFGVAAQAHVARAVVRTLTALARIDLGSPAAAARFRELDRQRLVTLDVEHAGTGRPVPSGRAQSVPGIMTFVVLMMTLIYGAVFLTVERRSGMLRRQATAPLTRRQVFLGKLLGRLLLAAAQIAVLVTAGRFLFGVSWGHSPTGLLLLLGGYAAAVGALSTLLGAVLRTPEQASAVGWILAMVLAALGGCWWPAELMPGWMRTLSHALPTAWAMDGFHALITFGHGLEAVLVPTTVLLGFAAVFSAAGARLLRFD
jgi:ABC-type multidrug transport system permease subunit